MEQLLLLVKSSHGSRDALGHPLPLSTPSAFSLYPAANSAGSGWPNCELRLRGMERAVQLNKKETKNCH